MISDNFGRFRYRKIFQQLGKNPMILVSHFRCLTVQGLIVDLLSSKFVVGFFINFIFENVNASLQLDTNTPLKLNIYT